MRVGRAPHPHLLPPWDVLTWDGRFDLPGRQARVLYLAERRLTAYLERQELQELRPNLLLLQRLAHARARCGTDPLAGNIGDELERHRGNVGVAWFTKYALVELSPRPNQKWLDLRDPFLLGQLREVMADWVIAHGFADLQFRDLLADLTIDDPAGVPVTQHISQLAFDSGFAGIVAPSRTHATGVCWILYEGAALEPEATIRPLSPLDTELQHAFRTYGLHPAPEVELTAREPARTVATGDVVRGVETEVMARGPET